MVFSSKNILNSFARFDKPIILVSIKDKGSEIDLSTWVSAAKLTMAFGLYFLIMFLILDLFLISNL